jgi:hypothetical protein
VPGWHVGGDVADANLSRYSVGEDSSLEAISPGRTRGWPKTASAEETPLISLGADRRPNKTQGR